MELAGAILKNSFIHFLEDDEEDGESSKITQLEKRRHSEPCLGVPQACHYNIDDTGWNFSASETRSQTPPEEVPFEMASDNARPIRSETDDTNSSTNDLTASKRKEHQRHRPPKHMRQLG